MGKKRRLCSRVAVVEQDTVPLRPQPSGTKQPKLAKPVESFLMGLSPLLQEQWLECSLGGLAADPDACTGFTGPPEAACTQCGSSPALHELLLSPSKSKLSDESLIERAAAAKTGRLQKQVSTEPSDPTDLLLGRTAAILQHARTAASKFRSLSWADSLLSVAAASWAEASMALDEIAMLSGKLGGGDSRARGVVDQLLNAELEPPELSRWSRLCALRAADPFSSATPTPADDEDACEAMIRLLCHIDETYFRLFYFTLTEAPASLARNTKGGVPDYAEFLLAAVTATWDGSSWCGDAEGFCYWLEKQYSLQYEQPPLSFSEMSPNAMVEILQGAARAVARGR